jgi:hypothetical protein
VPLHTTTNYDGQLTGQKGLHGLWESYIPELGINEYDLYAKHKAVYLKNPAEALWKDIRKANAYIYFYHWMRKTRMWSKPENMPYANKNIIKEMPTNLRGKYTSMPKKVEKLFKQENI